MSTSPATWSTATTSATGRRLASTLPPLFRRLLPCQALSPARIAARPLEFVGAPDVRGRAKAPAELLLVDGGVYDNMADQWGGGHRAREERLPARYENRWPDELIVANASAGAAWTPFRWGRVPLLKELFALLRDKSILYSNTTAPRRSALIDRFDEAELRGEGQRGAYVGIEQSPYRVADRWKDGEGPWAERGVRERTRSSLRLKESGWSRADWATTTRDDVDIGTQLSRMDPKGGP